jgi:Ca-activated chloride channel family protein
MLRALLVCLLSGPAAACQTALILAIDVSNSVDEGEYRLQVDGLADALLDPEVIEALLRDEVALLSIQWSGADRQLVTQDWARMTDLTRIAAFSAAARATPRAFERSDTAPAEAIRFALPLFDEVADCRRRVIDVSGDGTPNAGGDTRVARAEAGALGVTINGLAIESLGLAITGFYARDLITADGFVMTARGHRDYPATIRAKLLRELALPVG